MAFGGGLEVEGLELRGPRLRGLDVRGLNVGPELEMGLELEVRGGRLEGWTCSCDLPR